MSITFKEKSKEELLKLTPKRITAYFKAERIRYYKALPSPCECGDDGCDHPLKLLSVQDRETLDEWENYWIRVGHIREDILKANAIDVVK